MIDPSGEENGRARLGSRHWLKPEDIPLSGRFGRRLCFARTHRPHFAGLIANALVEFRILEVFSRQRFTANRSIATNSTP